MRRSFAYLYLLVLLFSTTLFAQVPLNVNGNGLVQQMSLGAAYWPTSYGFYNPVVMRANAGVSWYNIETARGVYSSTYGNLYASGNVGWVSQAKANGSTLLWTLLAPPTWATTSGSTSSASSNKAPYDIDTANETCLAVGGDASFTSATGDCITLEYAEAMMQKFCGLSQTPSTPLGGACAVHYIEGWNELNGTSYWNDTMAHLGKLDADFSSIVKAYCADCYVGAGSASCGGDNPSGACDVVEGQLLDAWHDYAVANSKPLPDFISAHFYPSRTNVYPVPMPETNISGDGSGLGNGTNGLGDSKCTSKNVPNIYCHFPVNQLAARFKALISARSWMDPNTPIWNTESGFYNNANLVDTTNSYTDQLRQAYVMRQAILLYSSGIALNIWYQMNNWCYGTLYTAGTSMQASGCPNNPVLPANTLMPAGKAMQTVTHWLAGATVTTPCKGSSGTNAVWTCTIQRPDGSTAQLAWWTGWENTTRFFTQYNNYTDVNGNVTPVSGNHLDLGMLPVLLTD